MVSKMKKVFYVYPYAFQYRRPFHEALRKRLAEHGIEYSVIYSSNPHFPSRGDFSPPDWAIDVKCSFVRLGSSEMRYQHALSRVLHADLVIIQQENGLVLNYILQVFRKIGRIRLAFFGHGRNFQAEGRLSRAKEKFKRFWLGQVDWWFAYTDMTKSVLVDAGYNPSAITVFNNAIDVSSIMRDIDGITPEEIALVKNSLFSGSDNVAIFIGGVYDKKRLPFLIEACHLVKARIPDFQLAIVGGGPDIGMVRELAEGHDWIKITGPKFGRDKSIIAKAAKVMLMPGLVGLSVLDAFAYEVPMVTTAVPYHSPEIQYLAHGENGIVVDEVDDRAAYAEAVIRLLTDDVERNRLAANGRRASEVYTVENMAEKFSDGVLLALGMRT